VLACRSRVWHSRGASLSSVSPQATYYRVRNYLLLERLLHGHGVVRSILTNPRFAQDCVQRSFASPRLVHAQSRAVLLGLLHARRGRTGRFDLVAPSSPNE
jgi:hypothetical protein